MILMKNKVHPDLAYLNFMMFFKRLKVKVKLAKCLIGLITVCRP